MPRRADKHTKKNKNQPKRTEGIEHIDINPKIDTRIFILRSDNIFYANPSDTYWRLYA